MNDANLFLAYTGNTGSKITSTPALLCGLFHRVAHSFNQIQPLLSLTIRISQTFHLGQADRRLAYKQVQEKRDLCKTAICRLCQSYNQVFFHKT